MSFFWSSPSPSRCADGAERGRRRRRRGHGLARSQMLGYYRGDDIDAGIMIGYDEANEPKLSAFIAKLIAERD